MQKFHSEAERKLATILERDTAKWFKPAKGQFQIFYHNGAVNCLFRVETIRNRVRMLFRLASRSISLRRCVVSERSERA